MSTAYVALPNIQGNLSAAPDQVGWVITAFVVATAIGTILTNVFSEKFGRRQIFLASIIGFTVTSLLAGTSSTLTQQKANLPASVRKHIGRELAKLLRDM